MANEKHCASLKPHTANIVSIGGYAALTNATVLANLIQQLGTLDGVNIVQLTTHPRIRAQSPQHAYLRFRGHAT